MFESTVEKLAQLTERQQHTPAPHQPKQLTFNLKGGGIFFFWMSGFMIPIQKHLSSLNNDKLAVRFQGASGALIAVLAACRCDLNTALESAHRLSCLHGLYTRPLGLSGAWGGIIRQWLRELLPDDAAMRCCDRVVVHLTEVPSFKKRVVDQFDSKEDVIDICLASCHVPFFLNKKFATKLCV